MTDFDPNLLLKTYLDLLPKRVETVVVRPRPVETPTLTGMPRQDVAALVLNHFHDQLTAEDEDLLYRILEGDTLIDDESRLDILEAKFLNDAVPSRVETRPKTEEPTELESETDAVAEPILREAAVQVLPPAGQTGVVVPDQWWKKP
jgi:hypothetical protein